MKLAQTCAIITGGASGLGEATARHFAENGAQVTILDRDADRGPKVAAEIGGHFVQTDVTDEDSVSAAIAFAVEKMGRISACVNCAGIAYGIKTIGRDGAHPLDAYKRTIDINLVGTFNVARLAAVEIAKNTPESDGARGVIINTASIAAYDGQKGQAAYAASKAAAISLTKTLGQSWARDGIRVNGLAPGLVPTKLTAVTTRNKERAEASLRAIPVRRMGTPEEMAGAAMFLASPLASYVQGHTLIADGGLTL